MPKPEGYLFVDHRASPGLTEAQARRMGYEPSLVGEGKVMEAATMTCAHCRNITIKNPLRQRERYYCMQCSGQYICDMCNLERLKPDYKHMPFQRIIDLVQDGKAEVVSLGAHPVLVAARKKEF